MTEERKVDWGRPIEAVHEDGRAVAVTVDFFDGETWKVTPALQDGFELFYPNGSNWSEGPWRIRNVAQPTLPDDLTARMVAAIRLHVAGKSMMYDDEAGPNLSVEAEFRAIVAEMEPVDGDLIEARKLAANVEDAPYGDLEGLALAAIKRGRALERGEGND